MRSNSTKKAEEKILEHRLKMKQTVDVHEISVAFREVLANHPTVNGFELATARYDDNWNWQLNCGSCEIEAGDWEVYVGGPSDDADSVLLFVGISHLVRAPGSEDLPTESGFVQCHFTLAKNGKAVSSFKGCKMPRIEARI